MNLDVATTKKVRIGTNPTNIASITDLSLLINFKRLTEITDL